MTGVIKGVTRRQLHNAISYIQSMMEPFTFVFRLDGMLREGKIDPEDIKMRFKPAGVQIDTITVDDKKRQVITTGEAPDFPELAGEQSRAVCDVLDYIAPYEFYFNGEHITLEPTPTVSS